MKNKITNLLVSIQWFATQKKEEKWPWIELYFLMPIISEKGEVDATSLFFW